MVLLKVKATAGGRAGGLAGLLSWGLASDRKAAGIHRLRCQTGSCADLHSSSFPHQAGK